MCNGAALAYRCDGSLAGILCCVYESYTRRELPADLLDSETPSLFPVREIVTDEAHALRVWKSLKRYDEAARWIRDCWLSCVPNRERKLFAFIRRLYELGESVCARFDDPVVAAVFKASRAIQNETHLLTQFIRFTEREGVLVAEISPKAMVLPLMTAHFVDRYKLETFIIFDRTHRQALFYRDRQAVIREVDELELAPADEEEKQWQLLWRQYYHAIAIKERTNHKCRMNHMPKRFWGHMLEMCDEGSAPPRPLPDTTRPRPRLLP